MAFVYIACYFWKFGINQDCVQNVYKIALFEWHLKIHTEKELQEMYFSWFYLPPISSAH